MILNYKEQAARKRVCLPLDGLDSVTDLIGRVRELSPVVGLFKVGYESFTRFGPAAIDAVTANGGEVFLDLKFHDIPNTVKGAARAATEHQVYMFNVHASGGLDMMKAAVEGANSITPSNARVPYILGVTVLTSINQETMNDQLRIYGDVADQVFHLAQLSKQAGLDGIVCSAADLYAVRDKIEKPFKYVTPGIQGVSTLAGSDQARVFSPGNAIRAGSDILVVGRAITDQKTPEARLAAGYEILKDMSIHL